MDLFEQAAAVDPLGVPLAERMRPKTLADVVGQPHLTGPASILTRSLKGGRVPSLVL